MTKTDNMTVTLGGVASLLALAAAFDAAVAADPENGAKAFLSSETNQPATILSADEMRTYVVTLEGADGSEPQQSGDERGMATWRGQLEQVVVAAKEAQAGGGATAHLTSGDNQYCLTLTFAEVIAEGIAAEEAAEEAANSLAD